MIKVVQATLDCQADVLALTGDFSGKGGIARWPNDTSTLVESRGVRARNVHATEEQTLRELRRRGDYLLRFPSRPSIDERERALTQARARRLSEWREYARARLKGRVRRVFWIPGNDDPPEVVAELTTDELFSNLDGRTEEFDENVWGGVGYSTPTPWRTYREASEGEIAQRLTALAGNASRLDALLVHVPPVGLGLDLAPRLLEKDGEFHTVPGRSEEVGSVSVRAFLEAIQPRIVLCGHCHDSGGVRRLGRSHVVNSGSLFHVGLLRATLLNVNKAHDGIPFRPVLV